MSCSVVYSLIIYLCLRAHDAVSAAYACVFVRVLGVFAFVCVCTRACVRACVRVCVYSIYMNSWISQRTGGGDSSVVRAPDS